jgi:hypothetical protein
MMVLSGGLACYCILCGAARKAYIADTRTVNKKGDPTIAITVMSLIGIIYILFCIIQVVYLFAGGLFVLPEKFTFAEYARRGFFELLTVTVINIVLMLICTTVFRESKILKGILTGITIGTYIMIASAAYRMLLYIGAYHLTFLRIFVLLFLLIDALVLAGIIISVYRPEFPLFKYCISVGFICYLVFSLSRPDYFIADYLIHQEEQLNADDFIYITREISYDAAPVVLPFLSEFDKNTSLIQSHGELYMSSDIVAQYIREYYDGIQKNINMRGIRDYNYSVKKASEYVRKYPMK